MSTSKHKQIRRLKREKHKLERLNRHNTSAFTISANELLTIVKLYANHANWKPTDETKDVKSPEGVIIGVEIIFEWVGPGEGPSIAQAMLNTLNERSKNASSEGTPKQTSRQDGGSDISDTTSQQNEEQDRLRTGAV